jgi:heme A synthase
LSVLLRIASVLSLIWAAGLYLLPASAVAGAEAPAFAALANGLAAANLGFAYLFWRAAANPALERGAIYTALLLFGLRAADGTYQVLYRLEGPAAVGSLVDMVLSIALFVGILNALPSALGARGRRHPPEG